MLSAEVPCVSLACEFEKANDFLSATEIATAYLEGRIRPLSAAIAILRYVDAWQPVWLATNGATGPLSAIYAASDEADRIGFLGDYEERWHPDVRSQKRAQLAEAEDRLAKPMMAACQAILSYEGTQHHMQRSN
ncbi:hypothetical protein MBTS_12380 [Methylobacterium bullatum]|nr:hypothetical protein [Methylobacterium bullatum]